MDVGQPWDVVHQVIQKMPSVMMDIMRPARQQHVAKKKTSLPPVSIKTLIIIFQKCIMCNSQVLLMSVG